MSGSGAPIAGGNGGLEAKPVAAEQFFVVFWKKSCFNTIKSHFARIQSHLKVLDF